MNSRGAEFENRSSTDFSGNSNATAFTVGATISHEQVNIDTYNGLTSETLGPGAFANGTIGPGRSSIHRTPCRSAIPA